jgi:hypothetical protein
MKCYCRKTRRLREVGHVRSVFSSSSRAGVDEHAQDVSPGEVPSNWRKRGAFELALRDARPDGEQVRDVLSPKAGDCACGHQRTGRTSEACRAAVVPRGGYRPRRSRVCVCRKYRHLAVDDHLGRRSPAQGQA